MKFSKWIINILLLFLTLFLVSGFQTTFWFQVFGSIPAPILWLTVYVYTMLYRPSTLSLVLCYAFMLVIFSMSAVSLGILSLSIFIMYVAIYFTRTRFYWGGPGYFSLMCTAAAFLFHIVFWLGSVFVEKNPAHIMFFDRVIQILLTPLFSLPLYYWLQAVDRWTIANENNSWQQEFEV